MTDSQQPQLEADLHSPAAEAESPEATVIRERLAVISGHLRRAQALLTDPTPDRIRQVDPLLERAFLVMQQCGEECAKHGAGMAGLDGVLGEFHLVCRRVRTLLTGAQRIHWHRIRRMGCFLETYTATGGTKTWAPASSHLNVEL